MLARGIGGDAQAAADLLERQPVAMPPDHHVAMVLLKAVEGRDEGELGLVAGHVGARRGNGGGQIAAGCRGQRNLAIESPLASRPVVAAMIGQQMRQDAPQPDPPLGLGPAPERGEVAMGSQERLLDQVGRPALALRSESSSSLATSRR